MFPECASKTPCNHVMCVLCVFCHLARCSPPAETEAAAADVFATEVGEKKATVQEESAKACFVFSALGGWGKAIRLLNHGIGGEAFGVRGNLLGDEGTTLQIGPP